VVAPYPSEKSWISSVGIMKFPIYGKINKCSKPPTSHGIHGLFKIAAGVCV